MVTYYMFDKLDSDEFAKMFKPRPVLSIEEASAVDGSPQYTNKEREIGEVIVAGSGRKRKN